MGLYCWNLVAEVSGLRPGPAAGSGAGWGETSLPRMGGHRGGSEAGATRAGRAPGPRPPTSKLSTLMGERGSRISASSFLWRLAPAPSPGTASGAPGIFPVAGGRLMPPPPGPALPLPALRPGRLGA